jgi:hypothetical protein
MRKQAQARKTAANALVQETQNKINNRWHCEGKSAHVVSRTFQWRILLAIVQNVLFRAFSLTVHAARIRKEKKPDITAPGLIFKLS